MKNYTKENLKEDIAWLEGKGLDQGEAQEFMFYLMNRFDYHELVECASCYEILRINSEDLNNTTCAYCNKEAK